MNIGCYEAWSMEEIIKQIAYRRSMAERDKNNIIDTHDESFFNGLIEAYDDVLAFLIDKDAEITISSQWDGITSDGIPYKLTSTSTL